MADSIVFYSWQSDLPNRTNRGLIKDALSSACKLLNAHPEVLDVVRPDQDTQGEPGSPHIPTAIMEKIDQADVFVADVSLCFERANGKMSPNPNVMFELGYAVARLSWKRIILVLNEQNGQIEKLPFDLNRSRVITYRSAETDESRSEAKQRIVSQLSSNIKCVLDHFARQADQSPVESTISSIQSQSSDRAFQVRKFIDSFVVSLSSKDPGSVSAEQFIDALKIGRSDMLALNQVLQAAAVAEDPIAIIEIWKGLEHLTKKLEYQPEHRGAVLDDEHDWWRYFAMQACILTASNLIKEQKFELLKKLLSRSIAVKTVYDRSGNVGGDYRSLCRDVFRVLMLNRSQNPVLFNKYSPIGHLYKEDCEASQGELDWVEYCEADLLLALIARVRKRSASWLYWRNTTHIYVQSLPHFVHYLKLPAERAWLHELFEIDDMEILKSWLIDAWKELDKSWPDDFHRSGVPEQEIRSFC